MDLMKEMSDKALEENSSIEPDDIFIQVMGADSRGRKRCCGRATFPGKSSNNTSNRESAEVTTLKRKVSDVEEELKSSQQKFSDLENTTNGLRSELDDLRGYLRMVLGDKFMMPPTQVPRTSSASSPSSATHSDHQ